MHWEPIMLQPWTLRLTRNAAALAAASPTLLFRQLTQKLAMYAGGGTDDRGEKRNVLIVSVLLLIGFCSYISTGRKAAS